MNVEGLSLALPLLGASFHAMVGRVDVNSMLVASPELARPRWILSQWVRHLLTHEPYSLSEDDSIDVAMTSPQDDFLICDDVL